MNHSYANEVFKLAYGRQPVQCTHSSQTEVFLSSN